MVTHKCPPFPFILLSNAAFCFLRLFALSVVQRIATEEAYCNVIGYSSEAQFFRRALENVSFTCLVTICAT